ALLQYEGTIIVVSHDRYFLDNVANKIWFIEDQVIKIYPGTYAEYDEWNAKRKYEPKAVPPPQPKKEEKKPEPVKQQNDDRSQQLKKLNNDLAKMEQQIAELEKTAKQLEAQLADDKIYTDSNRLKETNTAYQQKQTEIKTVKQNWENLAEQILEMEA
ncbi:MAG: ABC transporter ATP-binding protein, partial [Sphingobacteriales bacterium]